MKRLLLAVAITALSASTCFAADYDKTEKTDAYTVRLRVPDAAMNIPALKTEIFARWKKNAGDLKSEAVQDKKDVPQYFHPYELDTQWRTTFDSDAVISLSANSFIDEGGAHPNGAFDSIVWDRHANRAVKFEELFNPGDRKAAFTAIAASAKASFLKWMAKEDDTPTDPSLANDGIGADPNKLGHYALTYAAGQTKANGIVLLYGAGEVWPHVIGDVRLSIPVSVFRAYLTPEWRAAFN